MTGRSIVVALALISLSLSVATPGVAQVNRYTPVTDAMLRYSVVMTNTASLGEEKSFEWNYKSKNYRYDMYIDPDVYYEFKSLDHDISDEYDWP